MTQNVNFNKETTSSEPRQVTDSGAMLFQVRGHEALMASERFSLSAVRTSGGGEEPGPMEALHSDGHLVFYYCP